MPVSVTRLSLCLLYTLKMIFIFACLSAIIAQGYYILGKSNWILEEAWTLGVLSIGLITMTGERYIHRGKRQSTYVFLRRNLCQNYVIQINEYTKR